MHLKGSINTDTKTIVNSLFIIYRKSILNTLLVFVEFPFYSVYSLFQQTNLFSLPTTSLCLLSLSLSLCFSLYPTFSVSLSVSLTCFSFYVITFPLQKSTVITRTFQTGQPRHATRSARLTGPRGGLELVPIRLRSTEE
jgi:hypothetical protein